MDAIKDLVKIDIDGETWVIYHRPDGWYYQPADYEGDIYSDPHVSFEEAEEAMYDWATEIAAVERASVQD